MSKLKARSLSALTALAAAALCVGGAQAALAQSTSDQTPQSGTGATQPNTTGSPTGTPPPTQPSPSAAQPNAPAASAPAPAPVTSAPTPAAPATATNKVTYTGLIDAYYLFQFNNPRHLPQNNLGAPLYDVRHNQPSLALAELNIAKAANPNQLGFKATLIAGDTADINHGGIGVDSSTFQEARFKNIQQLYATYGLKGGAGIDFGKFYTPFGYEVTESNANYNYSRSDVYSVLLPFYHAGFRAYTPSYKGLVLTGYIVNSLNDTANEGVHDDNGDKAFLGQINYTAPSGKFVFIENVGYSRDKNVGNFFTLENASSGVYDTDKTTLSDTDFTYNVDANDLIGLNYVYRNDDGSYTAPIATPGGSLAVGPRAVSDDPHTATVSNGYAVYLRRQFTPKDAVALRYSGLTQSFSGSHLRLYDITGTFEIKNSSQFLTRFEYVHDNANANIYSGADGTGTSGDDTLVNPKKDQDTISASEVFTF